MQVEVRVFATLRRYLPDLGIGEAKHVQVPEGTTLDEIRNKLGLPAEEVKLIMVNHLQAQPQDQAQDGDRITFIPAVAGG
ncbi:MAG: MoaD/ThiS family protein [Anaerolineales bacterium]|jgi:molybdopterin converting factor small subunit